MWLRWVVNNLLSEVAEKKVRSAVDKARNVVERRATAPAPAPAPASPARPAPACDLVLIFALHLESVGLVDRMRDVVTTQCASFTEHVGTLDGRTVAVAESGVGQAAARKATEDIIQLYRPQWVVSAGFAGALAEPLQRGHTLMADEIIDTNRHRLTVPFRIDPKVVEATPSLHVGCLLTVDQLIRSAEEKRRLAADYQALACDMETMAVARVCRRQQVRFLSVRVISDALNDTLPPEIEHLIDQDSFAGKLGAATRAVFQRPSSLKDMWHLRDVALRTSERLAKFLQGVVPQLDTTRQPSD